MFTKNKNLFYLIVLLVSGIAFAQTFTKITTGDPVNDGGESFGAAWSDLNNDGYPDLFVSNGGAASINSNNFLYFNNGDGTFIKITSGDIIIGNQKSIGSTIADINNDGFDDIFVANRDGQNNFTYINNKDLSFSLITSGGIVSDGGNSNGSSFADFNNDGLIDIFVSNFFEKNFLYKNNGGFQFEKVENILPVDVTSTSISASWADFNNDGNSDLIIVNAAGAGIENNFYTNDGNGNFSSVVNSPVTTDKKASMGSSWGDYNNDGFLDLFIANQANFTNDLYKNNGDGTFQKITQGDIVNENSYSITGIWGDFNNDGHIDIYVTNWQNNKNFLFINDGPPNYTFTKITGGELVNDQFSSMGAACSDYDNDGDLDIFVANRDGVNNNFYRNEQSSGNWISLKNIGLQSNSSAIGTKVRIKSDINGNPTWQLREVNAQHGYNSQNDSRVHFGLGNSTIIDSMIVEWHSSNLQIFENVEVNRFYKLTEGGELDLVTSVEKSEIDSPDRFSLHQNYPNPFNPNTKLEYSLPEESFVELKIYDVLGREVAKLVSENKSPGVYQTEWDASNYSSGIYFYRLNTGEYSLLKKMTLVK